MSTRRRALYLIGLALVFAALPPATAVADHGTDSASGHVRLFGNTEVDFSARSTNVGTNPSGRIRLTQTTFDPNREFVAEVRCLRVVGATATTAATFVTIGEIVRQPPGSTAQSIIVNGSDGGKFSGTPDTLSAFASSSPAPTVCPTPFTGSLVAEGEVTVHNTLP